MGLVRLSKAFQKVKPSVAIIFSNRIQDVFEEVLKQSDTAFGPVARYPANRPRFNVGGSISFKLNINEVESSLRPTKVKMLRNLHDIYPIPPSGRD